MTVIGVFRLLLAVSIICDLVAWTWRDIVYTRVLEPDLAKGDTALMVTDVLFVVFAAPPWRRWKGSAAFMIGLTALAVIGRLVDPATPWTTNNAIMILEIIAATTWGGMLAIVLMPESRKQFDRGLL
ncbi:MAG: hypothetical protein AAFU68_01955 [Pseudomonadota bacterium]